MFTFKTSKVDAIRHEDVNGRSNNDGDDDDEDEDEDDEDGGAAVRGGNNGDDNDGDDDNDNHGDGISGVSNHGDDDDGDDNDVDNNDGDNSNSDVNGVDSGTETPLLGWPDEVTEPPRTSDNNTDAKAIHSEKVNEPSTKSENNADAEAIHSEEVTESPKTSDDDAGEEAVHLEEATEPPQASDNNANAEDTDSNRTVSDDPAEPPKSTEPENRDLWAETTRVRREIKELRQRVRRKVRGVSDKNADAQDKDGDATISRDREEMHLQEYRSITIIALEFHSLVTSLPTEILEECEIAHLLDVTGETPKSQRTDRPALSGAAAELRDTVEWLFNAIHHARKTVLFQWGITRGKEIDSVEGPEVPKKYVAGASGAKKRKIPGLADEPDVPKKYVPPSSIAKGKGIEVVKQIAELSSIAKGNAIESVEERGIEMVELTKDTQSEGAEQHEIPMPQDRVTKKKWKKRVPRVK